jgi:hypothetical protein
MPRLNRQTTGASHGAERRRSRIMIIMCVPLSRSAAGLGPDEAAPYEGVPDYLAPSLKRRTASVLPRDSALRETIQLRPVPRRGWNSLTDELERILCTGRSAWRVNVNRRGLERWVEVPVRRAGPPARAQTGRWCLAGYGWPTPTATHCGRPAHGCHAVAVAV